MSFRGKYPTKFRRTGNFRGHERLSYKERGRPFKRKYYDERESSQPERFKEHMPNRGRGRPVERERGFHSDLGRGKPFKKSILDRGMRPPRSRGGRFFRGRQGNFRGGRVRRFDFPREFDRERIYKKSGDPEPSDWPEESEFIEDERSFDRRANASDEWFEGDEWDEFYDSGEDHVPFEHGSRSPLTIHRRFDSEEFDHSPERSRSHLRRSPGLETTNFPGEREHSFKRRKSPTGRFKRRRDSVEHGRSHYSVERRGSFKKYRRSLSIDGREHQISVSPEERVWREGRLNKQSFERSLTPPRKRRSRERSFRGSERERSIAGSSRSLERHIAFEKERLQQMLEHEKKFHEKRSESSIERFLDDCKRSFVNKSKSPTISHSNSFDGTDNFHRKKERSFERSFSPIDQTRRFRGLENITIERGMSLERSRSPVRRSKSSRRRDEFSPDRQVSPGWRGSFREGHENHSDSGRRSRSPDYQRRNFMTRNFSPEVSYFRKSASPRNRDFRERPDFLGQRDGPFLEKQEGLFLEEPEGPFLEERERPFLEEREGPFLREQEKNFPGEQEKPFLEQERFFLENRPRSSEDRSYFRRANSLDIRESSFERRSPFSFSYSRSSKGNHFLGVGDGPFSENRSVGKEQQEYYYNEEIQDNSQGVSSDVIGRSPKRLKRSLVSQTRSYGKGEFSGKNTQLTPISQSRSSDRRETSGHHKTRNNNRMDLSSISHEGISGKKGFLLENKSDERLSPVSQTESFGKKESNVNSVNTCANERPNSTDSMQKFLAELEDDDKSMSSSEKCHFQGKESGSKIHHDNQCRGFSKQFVSVKKDENLMSSSHDPIETSRSDHNCNSSSHKEKLKDIPQKSSYNDFKCTYGLELNKISYKPFNEKKQQEELFNAYENSFLSQTCDTYNETLFQGRYEQSKSQIRVKSNLPNESSSVSLSQKTPIPSLDFNKTSELNPPNVPPVAQEISSVQPHYQDYNKNIQNQIPQNRNTFMSGINIRPEMKPLFPNQLIRPMFPFHQISTALPIPPMQLQPNTFLPIQSSQMLHPKGVIENNLSNSTFSQQTDKMSNQKPVNWQNQSARFQNNSEKSLQSLNVNQFQLHPPGNFNQSSQNQIFSQTENQQLYTIPQQSYSRHSEKQNQNAQLPNNFFQSQFSNPFRLPVSGPIQVPTSMPPDGKFIKKPPMQCNVKEVIIISDDEGQNKKDNNDGDDKFVYVSDGIIIPKAKVVEKYINCPPTYDVLGKMFKNFVIYFGIKENSELQKDPIEVLQESFSSSEGFERLDIEETNEYKPSSKPKQICQLRWKGLLLSRGEGESREEARQVAGIALINALAKTCYTIQTKYGYYNNGRYPKFMLKHPEKPGYYKMVKRDDIIKSVTDTIKRLKAQGHAARGVDATHVNAVISFMDELFQDQETHCELIFGPSTGMEYTIGELKTIASHAYDKGLQCRWFSGTKKVKVLGKFLCVSRFFSPQALQRYLLAEMGDTVRYRLFPPQGPNIDLLTSGNFYSPNMIKTILPIIGPDKSLNFDGSMNEFGEFKNPPGPDQDRSQQSEYGWQRIGDNHGSTNKGNIQSHQNPSLEYHSSSQNPYPKFQSPSHPFNPQSTGFHHSNQDSSRDVSHSLMPGGYKSNVPF